MKLLRLLTSVLVWVGVALAVYAAAYLPIQTAKRKLTADAISLTNDIKTLSATIAEMENSGSTVAFPAALIWNLASKTDAELALQDAIVGAADQYDLTLLTFGASPLTRDTQQNMAAFEFETEGPLTEVLSLLAELEQISPRVAIASLQIRPTQNYGSTGFEDVYVYSRVTAWAYWEDAS